MINDIFFDEINLGVSLYSKVLHFPPQKPIKNQHFMNLFFAEIKVKKSNSSKQITLRLRFQNKKYKKGFC